MDAAEDFHGVDESDDQVLHVHDLPQLWQKPSAQDLRNALEALALTPITFQHDTVVQARAKTKSIKVTESGVPTYLTSIIASRLGWVEDEPVRESIWDLASLRLSERSGRTAMPAMTREFLVTEDLTIKLHEPSLTGDNLGLKTWASSLMLSKQLLKLAAYLPNIKSKVLELGAGTGLVGISAACLWQTSVVLSDLPEIVPNLQHNLQLNANVIRECSGSVSAKTLDWSDATDVPSPNDKFLIIIAADPIYSPEHPKMLIDTVVRWLERSEDARLIIELPRRHHYTEERATMRRLLEAAHFELVIDGVERGFDDWVDEDGRPAEVECEFSIWKILSR